MRKNLNRAGRIPAAAAAGLALVLIVGESAAGEARDPMLVVLRSSAPVQGTFVRLGEVADLPNDPHRLRDFAGEILLGFTPGSGAVREISAEEVTVRLREAGLPEHLFCVKGAPRIAVFLQDAGAAPTGGVGAFPGSPADDGRQDDGSTASVRRAAAARSEAPASTARREARRPAPISARAESAPKSSRESAKLTTAKGARDVAVAGSGIEGRPLDKGEILVLRTAGQALSLEEPVRVVGSGPSPDLIEVQNIRTWKKMLARVLDRGVVTRVESPPAGEGRE